MKNNTLMWIVIGGVAVYLIYTLQQQQQANANANLVSAGGEALSLFGSDLANLGDL